MTLLISKQLASKYRVGPATIRRWAKEKKVAWTLGPGGRQMYHKDTEDSLQTTTKENIAYCHVSSGSQQDNLERQVAYFREHHPRYTMICNICSGLSFKQPGL